MIKGLVADRPAKNTILLRSHHYSLFVLRSELKHQCTYQSESVIIPFSFQEDSLDPSIFHKSNDEIVILYIKKEKNK